MPQQCTPLYEDKKTRQSGSRQGFVEGKAVSDILLDTGCSRTLLAEVRKVAHGTLSSAGVGFFFKDGDLQNNTVMKQWNS